MGVGLYKKVESTRDADGKTIHQRSRKWWGRYRDQFGIVRRVPLATDKSAALAMLAEIERKAERARAGVSDPFDAHAKTPLAVHLRDFENSLIHKGGTLDHAKLVAARARRLLVAECGFKFIPKVTASRVAEAIADLRDAGLSAQTRNFHLAAAKQFYRWLIKDQRTGANPLAHLEGENVRLDAGTIGGRRAMTSFRGSCGRPRRGRFGRRCRAPIGRCCTARPS